MTIVKRLADMLVRAGIERGQLGRIDADNLARVLMPVVDAIARERAAAELRDFADLIDRGPSFPMPPSIFSAMARERADDCATALPGGVR